ncbi:MAG: GNAT family N-acetyltransferase [Chloroflexota bacterium]
MHNLVEVGLKILPASNFTFEELTDAYNQTRQDYIVPMPMTVSRLAGYTKAYDVNLDASCVVVDSTEPGLIYGLGMLGVRSSRSWITRVGVLPYTRRLGTGQLMMNFLVEQSGGLGLSEVWLEVIEGNEPAHRMFVKNGFKETRMLAVCRRPPANPLTVDPSCLLPITSIKYLDHPHLLEQLWMRQERYNWLNQPETFHNLPHARAVEFEMESGHGAVFYEQTALQLRRVLVEVFEGDVKKVTATILHWLHAKFPLLDALCENLNINDPRVQGYMAVGYFQSFRRIEMVKSL